MIISFRHKFIFVAIPKTATHSIRNALRPQLAKNDWEQCVLFEKKFFPVDFLASIGHGHITCQQVKPFILEKQWNDYFKFAVVRNPFKRFFSYCYFIHRNNQRMQNTPLETMKKIIMDKNQHKRVLFKPQYKFITDKSENLMVDYICHLETLQKDFNSVCKHLNLPQIKLQKINSSVSSKRRTFLDEELKQMICDFYQKDFRIFNYSQAFD